MPDPLNKHNATLVARLADRVSGAGADVGNSDAGLPSTDQVNPIDRPPLVLNEAEARLDNIPAMVFQRKLHADGTISFPYANNAVLETAGLDPAIVTTNPAAVSDRIHPDDLAPLQNAVKRSFADMEAHSEEFRYHHPTLGWRWF
ncbi:MAG: hypothetical protein ACI9MU_004329, partial [Alphaproteobacteria bacterium]